MAEESTSTSEAWLRWRERVDLDEYDVRWDRLEAQGRSVHDEAILVDALGGDLILDAGCGTGRVAAELSRRGKQVVGVDNDADMLDYARRKPEPVRWELGDLAWVELGLSFDVVVMAGNILQFVRPETQQNVVANMAAHLRPGGLLVMGTGSAGCEFATVDQWCLAAGLVLVDQFSSWDRNPFDHGDYRVSIHRRTAA